MSLVYSLHSIGFDLGTEGLPEVELNEVRTIIIRELNRLPLREREALAAVAQVSDESCRDLAKRYRKCPQTVCNWASTAARKLRPRLEGCL